MVFPSWDSTKRIFPLIGEFKGSRSGGGKSERTSIVNFMDLLTAKVQFFYGKC